MPSAEQIVFPFASLDFPGRATITLAEIAEKTSCTPEHLLAEIDRGALVVLDMKGSNATRRNPRVPIEAYRAYVLKRVTGEFRADFIRDLPLAVRVGLMRDTAASLLEDAQNPADPKLRSALRSLQTLLAKP